MPVPIITIFDLEVLKEFYKDSLLVLTSEERSLVRSMPERLSGLRVMSQDYISDILQESYYNQRAVRNIIWSAATLYCELESYFKENTYKADSQLGSIDATKKCLSEFGYKIEEMELAKVFKSMLSDEQRDLLNSRYTFFVPE